MSKREVLVNARFLTQTLTGVQRFALEQVSALDRLMDRGAIDRERHSLVLIAPKGPKEHEPDFSRVSLRSVGRLKGHTWGQLELPYYARGKVLWSPTNTGPLYHARQVLTIHDASILEHPEWFSPAFAAWYRFLLPRLVRRAARLITDSEFSRGRLGEVLNIDPGRISVVPGGVDARFRPVRPEIVERTLERFGLPRDYVLALGSLEPRKNIAGLFEAWSLLMSRRLIDDGVHLVVAGGKSSIFQDAGVLKLPDRVVLTGYVSDEDLPALYSGALAFAYPSLYEGFGLPPLEAMACGVPVVTSGTTSIPEVTGNAALLVDPREAESIAEGLRSATDSADLRANLRAAGLERAKMFNWDNPARLVWKHLTEVAAAG